MARIRIPAFWLVFVLLQVGCQSSVRIGRSEEETPPASDSGTDVSPDGGTDSSSPDADAGEPRLALADGGWELAPKGLYGMHPNASPSLERHPVSGEVWLGTERAGLFHSGDDGQSWERTGISFGMVRSIVLHPTRPSVLWVLLSTLQNGDSLHWERSEDGGASFERIQLPSLLPGPNTQPFGLSMSASESVLWLLTESAPAVYRSSDLGRTWTPVGAPIGAAPRVVLAHPSNAQLAWIVGKTLYRTEDGGQIWTEAGPTLSPSSFSFAGNTVGRPLQFFAWALSSGASTPNLWRSIDGGRTWEPRPAPFNFTRFALATEAPDVLWAVNAATPRGLMISSDAGKTWSQAGLASLSWTAIYPRSATQLLIADRPGVRRSTDAARTWAPAVEGLSALTVQAVAVSADGRLMLAGTNEGRVFHSEDFGKSWKGTELPLKDSDGLEVTAVAIDPSNPKVLYAQGGKYELFKSVDGGVSFTRVTPPGPGRLAVSAAGVLFVGRSSSLNGGITWETTASATDFNSASSIPGSQALQFLSWEPLGALRVSGERVQWQPLATNWHVVGPGPVEVGVASHVAAGVYYGRSLNEGHLGKYTGGQWGLAEVGFEMPMEANLRVLAAGAHAGEDVLLGAGSNHWLYSSHDGAETWRSTPAGISFEPLAISVAANEGFVGIIGLEGMGVAVTRTGGR